jgi:hypothetical protein
VLYWLWIWMEYFSSGFCICCFSLEFTYSRYLHICSTFLPSCQFSFPSYFFSSVTFSERPFLVTQFRISIPHHHFSLHPCTHSIYITYTQISVSLPTFFLLKAYHLYILRFFSILSNFPSYSANFIWSVTSVWFIIISSVLL